VGHVDDVDALGEDELEDRLAEHLPGRLDGDRPEARDLARLAGQDVATGEGLEIEAQHAEISHRVLVTRSGSHPAVE
jgi:hypothetical protein